VGELERDLPRRYGAYICQVDPLTVRYPRKSHEWPDYVRWWSSAVCWGDWDRHENQHRPFREEQMEQLFVHGLPYRQTEQYQEMVAELRARGCTSRKGCRSVADIDAYFEGVLRLYDRIRREGYQRRSEEEARSREITVRIARDGAFLKCGAGTHRLAIARLLRLPSVPVVVDLMHGRWATRCAATRGLPIAVAVHEKLRDLAKEASSRLVAAGSST
jgi:hypothetical protein